MAWYASVFHVTSERSILGLRSILSLDSRGHAPTRIYLCVTINFITFPPKCTVSYSYEVSREDCGVP